MSFLRGWLAVAVICGSLVGSLLPRAAQAQACANDTPAPTVTTCTPGDVVDFNYGTPTTTELRLEGGDVNNPLTFDYTALSNVLVPTELVLTTSGFVQGGPGTTSSTLVDVYNELGGAHVTIGANTTLTGLDQRRLLSSAVASTLATTQSLIDFSGTLQGQYSATPLLPPGPGPENPRVGLYNIAFDAATAWTRLTAGSSVLLSAPDGTPVPAAAAADLFGVFADATGTGDALIDSQATVTVTSATNYRAGNADYGAALSALAAAGSATINSQGVVVVDNRRFAGTVTGVHAVLADVDGPGLGNSTVNLLGSGTIETFGPGTAGIGVFNGASGNSVVTTAGASKVTTHGDHSDGVFVDASIGNLSINAAGTITASGEGSRGIVATSRAAAASAVAVIVGNAVDTVGKGGVSLELASDAAPVTVQIGQQGRLGGGWSAQPQDVDALTGLPAAGLALRRNTSPVSVANAGAIGALSDRAITALATSGPLTLNNTGTVTGFWALSAAADSVVNNGLVEARDFADSDGNGTRDTKRIATLAFGGGDDVMRNEAGGTLRLGRSAATTTVTDGQYLPDLMPVAGYATSTAGVEQAHFTQLERFEHRGTITLRDVDAGGAAPVAGDVLLMTSGTIGTTGTLTPGAAPMVFLSDGGSLALDTELNEGGASSHSDMLLVDAVQLGPNGPTRIFITNAGGLGAATTGAGIKLVDVLGGGVLSAENAFVLGGPVVAGAFTYNLFRSAPLGTDGDWYLRTAAVTQPPPPPVVPPPGQPPPPPPPPPPLVPTYRPEAALFSAMPGMLRIMDSSVPGTRQSRLGDEAGGLAVARRGRVWARYVQQDIDASQQGTVAPSVHGDATGYQFGVELFGGKDEAAAQIGVYGGQVEGDAEVNGSANGVAGAAVGRLEPKVTYAGLYVSRSRGRGLYFDAVLQYGFYDGTASTYADGVVADIRGTGGYASLETGYGFALPGKVVIEPQFQIVTQPQRLHDIAILNANVRQSPANTLAGRAGVRVKGDFGTGAVRFQPYVGASLWQGLDHTDETRFSGNGTTQTTLEAKSQLKALEFNAGFSLSAGSRLTGFAEYGRLNSRGDAGMEREGTLLSAGVRFAW